MAARRSSPTVRRRRLSAELRRLRDSTGRTASEVARALEWATSKLTRMERNEWLRPSVQDIRALLDEYGVTDEPTRTRLFSLAREGRQRGWWDPLGLWSGQYSTLIGLEEEADTLYISRTLVVPGLLQTEDYARAQLRGGPAELSAEEVDRRVGVRMERQKILERDDHPRLWVIMDEATLRREVGSGDVMRAQMRRLLEVAEMARVTLQVIPFKAGSHPGTEGSFQILRFPEPEDQPAVYIEHIAGQLFIEEPSEVQQYEVAFQRLQATALSPDATINEIAAAERAAAHT